MSHGVPPAALLTCAFLVWSGVTRAEALDRFEIGVEFDGVQAVHFEDLAGAGFEEASVDAGALALSHQGFPVPFVLRDDGDGRFGPGDQLLFLGRRLAGERSFHHPYSPYNPYYLDTRSGHGTGTFASPRPGPRDGTPANLRSGRHFEPQSVMVRFHASDLREDEEVAARDDFWFWAALSMIQEPLGLTLELPGLDARAVPDSPISARIRLRGWSDQGGRTVATKTPDHRVEVLVAGTVVAAAEWDGQESVELDLPTLAPPEDGAENVTLELRVPPRILAGASDPVVDASLLDWIDVEYPRSPDFDSGSGWIEGPADSVAKLTTRSPQLVAFDDSGRPLPVFASQGGNGRWEQTLTLPNGPVWVAPAGGETTPSFVIADRPSSLAGAGRQVDYLIISSRLLIEAIHPLAVLHRDRGLSVEVVDVEDVYDEFDGGVADPAAIKSFLRHVVEEWPKPAPRFVLLVGDASWDLSSAADEDGVSMPDTFRPAFARRIRNNPNRPQYEIESAPRSRNLIPAWRYQGPSGPAASDNWLAALQPGSRLPVLAIGRLPVTTPEEVSAYVTKALAYARASDVGPWRRRLLLVTNQVPQFQQESDAIASRLAGSGISPTRIYPAPDTAVADYDRSAIRRAFDDGNLLVHFWGHGGRFLWRTGPPDLEGNRDLFTLDDLDALAPTSRLPVVLSMTCFSAPFDHPTADSIGEKLLRLPDRGAIAVVAAAWRAAPNWRLSQDLLEAFTRYDTIGEAFLAGKRKAKDGVNLAIFNLLGDPALPLDRPPNDLAIEPGSADSGDFVVKIPPPLERGRALIDWLGDGLEVLDSQSVDIRSPALRIHPPEGLGRPVRALHVYAWDASTGVDAVGGLELPPGGVR